MFGWIGVVVANERGRNKKNREQKKIARLMRLLGIDLCACGGGQKLKCQGVCREHHTNPKTGKVECVALYQVDCSEVKRNNSRRSKLDRKQDNKKNVDESKLAKDQRRGKIERDRSESSTEGV